MNRSTKQENKLLLIIRHCCGTSCVHIHTWYVCMSTSASLYAQNAVIFSSFGSFLWYTNYTELIKVAAFIKPPTTEPSNALNQDKSQLFPAGRLPRSCTLGMAPARRSCTHQSKRGENGPHDHTSNQSFTTDIRCQPIERLHCADFSTTPLPHTTYLSAGGVAEICRVDCMVCRLPWDRVIVGFPKATCTFFTVY